MTTETISLIKSSIKSIQDYPKPGILFRDVTSLLEDLALELGVGFVPVRKPGKLPRPTIAQSYELEYGIDTLEIHTDAIVEGDKVLVVDWW